MNDKKYDKMLEEVREEDLDPWATRSFRQAIVIRTFNGKKYRLVGRPHLTDAKGRSEANKHKNKIKYSINEKVITRTYNHKGFKRLGVFVLI